MVTRPTPLLLLFAVAASCGRGTPPSPPAPSTSPAPRARPRPAASRRALAGYPPPAEPDAATCTLTGGWAPDQPHELRFRRGGRTFVTVNGVDKAVLSLGEDPASPFVELSSPHARLWGFVEADKLLIHPSRPQLLVGYAVPGPTALLRWLGTRGEPARVEVVLPEFVKPVAPPEDEVSCGDLSIDELEFDPRDAIEAPEGTAAVLVENKTIPLGRSASGPASATIDLVDHSSPMIEVVERQGDRARIVVHHSSLNPQENVLLVGWVDAKMVDLRPSGFGGSWGSGGDRAGSLPRPRKDWKMVTCSHEVPLVVELEGERHLVGAASSGVRLEIPPDAGTAGEQLIEITVRSRQLEFADDTRVLTRGEAVADCSPTLAPEL